MRFIVVGLLLTALFACGQDKTQVVHYDPATEIKLRVDIDALPNNVTSAGTVFLSGTVSGGDGLQLTARNMDKENPEEIPVPEEMGRWQSELPLNQGLNQLRVQVTDALGRTAQATVNIFSTQPLNFIGGISVSRNREVERELGIPDERAFDVNFRLNGNATVKYFKCLAEQPNSTSTWYPYMTDTNVMKQHTSLTAATSLLAPGLVMWWKIVVTGMVIGESGEPRESGEVVEAVVALE